MTTQTEASKSRHWFVLALLSPLLFALLVLVVAGLPFYWLYGLLLRMLVQGLWVARGKCMLLVYSRSPVWQGYIETNWLPRLGEHAVILNWSDRQTWPRWASLAPWVFQHWAGSRDYNPMAVVFPRFPRTRKIGFFYAFRDWKHGNDASLRAAEAQLFEFVNGAPRLSAPGKRGSGP